MKQKAVFGEVGHLYLSTQDILYIMGQRKALMDRVFQEDSPTVMGKAGWRKANLK